MDFFIFSLTFISIVNRSWMMSFWQKITGGKIISKELTDEAILNLIKKKTGLTLSKIIILDTKRIWGLMAGWPMKPYMIISKDAYENFNQDEMQWLLFHESGHYILWHSGKMILLHLLFLFIGFLVLPSISSSNILLPFLLGILFAIIYIQIARRFEYEANYFAISKMDNPKGLSGIYDKSKQKFLKKGMKENSLWQKLFKVWNLGIYKDLIKRVNTR